MKLRSIQLLRGIAAMAVVAHHAFPGQATIGAAGVDLFFVISGFIMATCASGRGPAEFLADRAWRIYPMWLVALAPWLVMAPHTPWEIVRSITLWPVFAGQYLNPALGVGWTLSFELVFYLGFALALATRPSIPLATYALGLLLGLHTRNVLFWFIGSPLTFEFLLGAAITRFKRVPALGAALIAAGAIWFTLAPSTYYDQAFGKGAIYRFVAWGIPAAMILYGAWSLDKCFARKGFALPVLIGSASYSIYLFHPLVFLELHGLAGFILSALVGIAVYYGLERRIMRARPKWRTGTRQTLESGDRFHGHVTDPAVAAGISPSPAETLVEHEERFA